MLLSHSDLMINSEKSVGLPFCTRQTHYMKPCFIICPKSLFNFINHHLGVSGEFAFGSVEFLPKLNVRGTLLPAGETLT